MRGLAAPSPGARASVPTPAHPLRTPGGRPAPPTTPAPVNLTPQHAAAAAGGKALKRKLKVENDGRLATSELVEPERHVMIDGAHAVDLGLCSKSYAKSTNTCPYVFCPYAADLQATKCGQAGKHQQKGRARAQEFCVQCRRFFHCTCHAIMHRRIEASPLLLAAKRQKTKSAAAEDDGDEDED